MSQIDTTIEEFTRFYKVNKEGRWHQKSAQGSYEEMKDASTFKRLQVLTAKSPKRIE